MNLLKNIRCLVLIAVFSAVVAEGQTFQLLHAFSFTEGNGTEGNEPYGKLLEAADGSFYGVTHWGGEPVTNDQGGITYYNAGTIFNITKEKVFTLVASFHWTNGGDPHAPLVQAADGSLYGATDDGGPGFPNGDSVGTIFRVMPDGALTSLAAFSYAYPNGYEPNGVTQASDGNFYGSTWGGGKYLDSIFGGGLGTIFKMSPDGTLITLVSFNGTNGMNSGAPLIQASDGNLYGTTTRGGHFYDGTNWGFGTVFKLSLDGSLTTIHEFDGADGTGPSEALIQASDGYLYGSTGGGGVGYGTIFRVSTNGDFHTVVTWDSTMKGGRLIEASDGFFYGIGSATGITNGEPSGVYTNGAIFRMTREGQVNIVFSFNSDSYYDNPTGRYPTGIMEGSDGNLYGTCADGPDFFGYGTIFRLIMPRPQLILRRTANQITFSWPTNFPGFKLQSADDLNSTNWIDCADSPATVGEQYVVTNSASAGGRFYRLKR